MEELPVDVKAGFLHACVILHRASDGAPLKPPERHKSAIRIAAVLNDMQVGRATLDPAHRSQPSLLPRPIRLYRCRRAFQGTGLKRQAVEHRRQGMVLSAHRSQDKRLRNGAMTDGDPVHSQGVVPTC